MLLQAESEVEVKGENANKNQDKDKDKHKAEDADVVDDKHEYDDRDDDDHLKTGVDFAYRNCVDSKQSNYEDGVEVSASYYDEVKDKDKLDDDDEDSNDDWNSLTLEGLLEEATKAILLKHNCDVEATESKLKQIITTLRTDVTNVQQTNSMLTTEKEQALAEVQRGNATITTLRTKMANLQHKNTSLVTEKEQAIVEIDKGKAAIITVRTEVAILQQTISTLTTEKEQASAEADLLATETKATLQRANDETTRKRETIRMKEKILSELKAEQVDQQAQLEDVRADLEASNTENQLLLPLTNQLQTRIDMLVEKVRIIADLKAENVDQQTQLDDVHTQLEAAKTENTLLLPLTHQLQKRIDMMMEEFQMVSELKVEKVVHQKQLEDVRTQLEVATSELQRIVPLTNQLQTTINIVSELKAEKGVHQKQLEDVRTQLETATVENQRIVPLTNQLQTRINMLVEEGQIVSELKAEKGIHLEQLEEVTTQLVATATENKRLLPLTNQLQTRIDMLTEVGVDQQTQLGDIRTQLEAATTENGRLLPLTNQLQTRITVLMDEFQIISELKAEKVVHLQQLEEVTTQLVAALAENQRTAPLMNQLQARIEMLTDVVQNNLMNK